MVLPALPRERVCGRPLRVGDAFFDSVVAIVAHQADAAGAPKALRPHDDLVPELRQPVRGGAGKSTLQTQAARERRVRGDRVRLPVGDEARLFDAGLWLHVENAEEASDF